MEDKSIEKHEILDHAHIGQFLLGGKLYLGKRCGRPSDAASTALCEVAFASVLLLIIANIIEKPNCKQVSKSWPILLFLEFNGLIGYNLALYTALTYTTIVNASLVSALNPALMVAVFAVVLHEKLSVLQKLGIVFYLLGVLVILTQGNIEKLISLDFNRGDLLMLVAISVWTVYSNSIIGKRLKDIKPITASAAAALLSALVMLHVVIYLTKSPITLDTSSLLSIIYIVLFPSMGSLMFWNLSVRQIGTATAGVILNLIPVFTSLFSIMMGESITLPQIIGGLMVFAGVYTTSGLMEKQFFKRNKKRREAV
jgi:drug/metabolite transporter (DMT)-like permease